MAAGLIGGNVARRGSVEWREAHWPSCDDADTVVQLWGKGADDREIVLWVARRWAPVAAAMKQVIDRHGYQVRGGDTGAFNCRHMRHDPDLPLSAHAYGIAIDINWATNPDGSRLTTDMPQPLIDDLQAIHLDAPGGPLWVHRWGGDWDRDPRTGHSYYDAMHWEGLVTPAELDAYPLVIPEGQTMDIIRVAGRDRYETAAVAERFAPPDGRTIAVVARGDEWTPDAMVAAALAARYGGLPLWVTRDTLPDVTAAAIRDSGAEVAVIVGGPEAVSARVEAQLARL